jgi:hypothetical protein
MMQRVAASLVKVSEKSRQLIYNGVRPVVIISRKELHLYNVPKEFSVCR